jgi:hypothetical protein
LKPTEQPPHEIRENLRFIRIQTQTVLDGPDIHSIKVIQGECIHTTNTFIEAARIITQIELRIVKVHIKSTKVDLGNHIVDEIS